MFFFWSSFYFKFLKFWIKLPLIQRSVKLKRGRVDHIKSVTAFDSQKLNKEREKLVGGRKVIIYIEEEYFMHLKWMNNTVDMNSVELRWAESYEWPYHMKIRARNEGCSLNSNTGIKIVDFRFCMSLLAFKYDSI